MFTTTGPILGLQMRTSITCGNGVDPFLINKGLVSTVFVLSSQNSIALLLQIANRPAFASIAQQLVQEAFHVTEMLGEGDRRLILPRRRSRPRPCFNAEAGPTVLQQTS